MEPLHRIVICMGSSCFARGNRRHLAVIEAFLAKRGLSGAVSIEGSHCEELCAEGPNLRIDDQRYHRVDEGTLLDVLAAHFPEETEA